jgi:hypothetical protein
VRRLIENLWFVLAHPHDLGRGEAGQHLIAGQLQQPIESAHLLGDRCALFTRALIVPQNGGTQNVIGSIEHDQAVHLPRQSDRGHFVARSIGFAQCSCDAGNRALPPIGRILLRPQRLRRRERIFGRVRGDYRAALVDQQRFRAGRGDIDAEKECHERTPPWSVVRVLHETRTTQYAQALSSAKEQINRQLIQLLIRLTTLAQRHTIELTGFQGGRLAGRVRATERIQRAIIGVDRFQ